MDSIIPQPPLVSFRNSPNVKSFLLREMKRHIKADQLVQGIYWNGKHGCFIGCAAGSSDPADIAEDYGWPTPYTRIVEEIFEAFLDVRDARDFAVNIIEHTPEGIDLRRPLALFYAQLLQHQKTLLSNDLQTLNTRTILLLERFAFGSFDPVATLNVIAEIERARKTQDISPALAQYNARIYMLKVLVHSGYGEEDRRAFIHLMRIKSIAYERFIAMARDLLFSCLDVFNPEKNRKEALQALKFLEPPLL